MEHDPVYTTVLRNGAISVKSGDKTGRCPKDKRIVYDDLTKNIDWNDVNIKMSERLYRRIKKSVEGHLDINSKDVLVVYGRAGWENSKYILIYCSNPYHAIFMKNMLVDSEVYNCDNNIDRHIQKVDFTIYAFGNLKLSEFNIEDIHIDDLDRKNPLKDTMIGFNFSDESAIILGTEYAGEIKKAIFTYMLYIMPKEDMLPLHSSANVDENGNTTLFLGLSGTGKTTLSSDKSSFLIGDDEHIWWEEGVYNIEGGCYAKCINLDKEKEPQIYNAIRNNAVMENVVVTNGEVDYNDSSITENTRCCYPLNHIDNSIIPAVCSHPKNIIFLTCDASGLLPPVSVLEGDTIKKFFMVGYTSKMVGVEIGVKKTESTFSPCFAGPFIVWHPEKYANMLIRNVEKHKSKVWLVNTGYTNNGKRYPINYSRKIIDYIKNGKIYNMKINNLPYFDIKYYTGHTDDVCIDSPSLYWSSYEKYKTELKNLHTRMQSLWLFSTMDKNI